MDWKRIFLRCAGFGAGFALILAAIVAVALWYESRPKPPKPWDTGTIKAEYDGNTDEHADDIGFRYFLKNNGLEDYRVSDATLVQLSIRIEKGELTPFNRLVSIETPIFVPAGQKTLVFIKMKTGTRFEHSLPDHPSDADVEQYRKAILDYLNGTQITGFALFDEVHRIEIDFPSGWRKPQSQK
jgi:hypothetical protein